MTAVAIDCEMVRSGNQPIIGKVSIVDQQGKVLLDEYVKPTVVVTDYLTDISGITQNDLYNGKPLNVVQSLVANLIKGQILVGHSLQNDLERLGLSHPECNRRDLAKYAPFMKYGQPQSLKDLAREYLRKTIQNGPHNSVVDAQTTMELFNKYWN